MLLQMLTQVAPLNPGALSCSSPIEKQIPSTSAKWDISGCDQNEPFHVEWSFHPDLTASAAYFHHFEVYPPALASIPNLPPFDSKRFKYTLCLDIDHTLLRSRNLASPHHAEADPEFFNLPKSIACRFIFDVDKDRYQTILRPYVIEFLRRMSELGFEIILFTSGGIDYSRTVGRILNQRAGCAVIHHCVARDQCFWRRNHISRTKDLRVLGRDFAKLMIVDDDPEHLCWFPDNSIVIEPFPRKHRLDAVVQADPQFHLLKFQLASASIRNLIGLNTRIQELVAAHLDHLVHGDCELLKLGNFFAQMVASSASDVRSLIRQFGFREKLLQSWNPQCALLQTGPMSPSSMFPAIGGLPAGYDPQRASPLSHPTALADSSAPTIQCPAHPLPAPSCSAPGNAPIPGSSLGSGTAVTSSAATCSSTATSSSPPSASLPSAQSNSFPSLQPPPLPVGLPSPVSLNTVSSATPSAPLPSSSSVAPPASYGSSMHQHPPAASLSIVTSVASRLRGISLGPGPLSSLSGIGSPSPSASPAPPSNASPPATTGSPSLWGFFSLGGSSSSATTTSPAISTLGSVSTSCVSVSTISAGSAARRSVHSPHHHHHHHHHPHSTPISSSPSSQTSVSYVS